MGLLLDSHYPIILADRQGEWITSDRFQMALEINELYVKLQTVNSPVLSRNRALVDPRRIGYNSPIGPI
jgi:hypothetical protein